jgi:anti-sigma regulatory factor (Ser/Thr protein kinase)
VTIQVQDIASRASEHLVQFYDRESDLVASVGAFLFQGLQAGEVAVVIATRAHRGAFEDYLVAAGFDVAGAVGSGSLVLLDAAATLSRFVATGSVVPEQFRSVIGGVLRQGAGRRIRAYGEMVALLWDEGCVPAAIDLEGLWNDMLREFPVSLLCAYPSQSFSGLDDADAMREVCDLHSAVVSSHGHGEGHGDGSSPSGLREVVRRFSGELDSPQAARRFVVGELQSRSRDDRLVYEAALVVTELAANAVLHAGSAFVVTLSVGLGAVRISVHDSSSVLPTPRRKELMGLSGRGLRLVDVLADRWGVDVAIGGKVVWVELADVARPEDLHP